MKAEAGICLDDSNVEDKREATELLAPEDQKELLVEEPQQEKANELDQADAFEVEGSFSICKGDGEQKKLVEECLLEIESSEDINSLVLPGNKLTKTCNLSG